MEPDTRLVVGSREEFGFPASPTVYEVKRWTLQEAFLAEYSKCGAVYKAAAAAGCTYQSTVNWLDLDSFSFQKRYQEARARYLEKMALECDRRALEGVDHPVIHLGVITDTYKQYSDNLLMFRMKKLDPSYRENYELVENVSEVKDLLTALRAAGIPRVVEGNSRPADEQAQPLPEPQLPES